MSNSNKVQKAPTVVIDGGKKFKKGGNSGLTNVKLPKVELTKFGGNNPREWVKKC